MGPFFKLRCLLYFSIKMFESFKIEAGVMCCFGYMILMKRVSVACGKTGGCMCSNQEFLLE
jgi:hypothetical protein